MRVSRHLGHFGIILEYCRETIAKPDKVLFVEYDNMMLEPTKYVISLAEFLSVPFSDKEFEDGVSEDVVRLCSFENLSSPHSNQIGAVVRRENLLLSGQPSLGKGRWGIG